MFLFALICFITNFCCSFLLSPLFFFPFHPGWCWTKCKQSNVQLYNPRPRRGSETLMSRAGYDSVRATNVNSLYQEGNKKLPQSVWFFFFNLYFSLPFFNNSSLEIIFVPEHVFFFDCALGCAVFHRFLILSFVFTAELKQKICSTRYVDCWVHAFLPLSPFKVLNLARKSLVKVNFWMFVESFNVFLLFTLLTCERKNVFCSFLIFPSTETIKLVAQV